MWKFFFFITCTDNFLFVYLFACQFQVHCQGPNLERTLRLPPKFTRAQPLANNQTNKCTARVDMYVGVYVSYSTWTWNLCLDLIYQTYWCFMQYIYITIYIYLYIYAHMYGCMSECVCQFRWQLNVGQTENVMRNEIINTP